MIVSFHLQEDLATRYFQLDLLCPVHNLSIGLSKRIGSIVCCTAACNCINKETIWSAASAFLNHITLSHNSQGNNNTTKDWGNNKFAKLGRKILGWEHFVFFLHKVFRNKNHQTLKKETSYSCQSWAMSHLLAPPASDATIDMNSEVNNS